MRDRVTRDEIINSTHSEFNDEVLLDMASRVLGIGIHQIIFSAMRSTGSDYSTHVDEAYKTFWAMGRVSKRVRQFTIDVLVGKRPVCIDQDGKEAILIA